MEVIQVLHMKGGLGKTSYATNSWVQKKVISMTKPITEEAITKLYCSSFPTSLAIADLGCSSGPNTLFLVSELIKTVENIRQKLGLGSPEYHVLLNDLPGNDFNTIFRCLLPDFQTKLKKQIGPGLGPCLFSAFPGSFYGRLFPKNSLHFVHSSYSLQWLSQVPEGLKNNKRNIYMASTSPPNVLKAYYEQFQRDFLCFLKCRSEEVVSGGRMVLTFLGRRSEDPSSKEGCYIWELLAMALDQMVSEGLIEEEKLESFNIPQYTPSPTEVKSEVLQEGSFSIDRMDVTEVNWNVYHNELNLQGDAIYQDGGYNVAQCMRAVAEPLLVSHFGEGIIEEVFCRYREIITDRMSREKTEFVNVIVALTKKS
uniref:SABATH methyltransferase 1 n=1 Tax=Bixa orellana TaxID=66672 RepID=A0A140CWU9_BIXOR|nr:SABATH methyltransferase 1 [Bixa orellana]